MPDEENYQPETEEAPQEASEETGEQEVIETEQAEEESAPAAPVEKTVPLKAVQEERRKRQELEREVAQLRQQQAPPPPVEIKRPKVDDFSDYDDYSIALSQYAYQVERAKEIRHNQEQQEQREQAKFQAKLDKATKAATDKYDDFIEVSDTVILPLQTLKAMFEDDLGTELIYYLGKNPDELERLQGFSLARQVKELGRLETKLSAKIANPKSKEVKKATEVESSGQGFPKARTDISKILEKAKATGNWAAYLEATGNL